MHRINNKDGSKRLKTKYTSYIYQGNIGLNPKQFRQFAESNELKYSGELLDAFSDFEKKYIKKYSFVLPTYFLYNVYNGFTSSFYKNLRNKLHKPFIHNIKFNRVLPYENIGVDNLTDLPKHVIILNKRSYEYNLIEKLSMIQD